MESRLTEEERALVTDATRKLLSVVDCFDPVACDSAMSNIMLVVSSIADARARRAREVLRDLHVHGYTTPRQYAEINAEIAALGGK